VQLHLLQCRPQSSLRGVKVGPLPLNLPAADKLFYTTRMVPQGDVKNVDYLVYVDPLAHGKGVGADLLKNLIEEARGLRNCKTIVATMATDNLPSLKLHKRLGFEEAGIIPNAAYKFTRWMDIALLQRSLEH